MRSSYTAQDVSKLTEKYVTVWDNPLVMDTKASLMLFAILQYSRNPIFIQTTVS
jgi:hypothetical protein